MNQKLCPICGCPLQYEDIRCHICGAELVERKDIVEPKTIDELTIWCESNNIPINGTNQFQIGEDCDMPGCFGIYKINNETIIVYKILLDGERLVRYQGADEQFAVSELWQKIKEIKYGKPPKERCDSTQRKTPYYKATSRKEKDFMVPIAKKMYLDNQ